MKKRVHTVHFTEAIRLASSRYEKSISHCNSHDRRFEVIADFDLRVVTVDPGFPAVDIETALPPAMTVPFESVRCLYFFPNGESMVETKAKPKKRGRPAKEPSSELLEQLDRVAPKAN